MANHLAHDKQIQIIALLVEGNSLRAISRLTDVHRDTIGRLAVRIGEACKRLHDRMIRGLHVNVLELDEAWSFVGCKQKRVTDENAHERGDQYAFIGMDATRKAIISYRVGKRSVENTNAFVQDLRSRIVNRPQITTDGFVPYIEAIEEAFGNEVDYAMLVKLYGLERQTSQESAMAASKRYSPGRVVGIEKKVMQGKPDSSRISTSFVERQNLTLRMHMRRFTRLTNGFSKKLRNHKAALALHIAWYNLCRVHETLQITPAMEIDVTDHVWSIDELLDVALGNVSMPMPAPTGGRPMLRLIKGGLDNS